MVNKWENKPILEYVDLLQGLTYSPENVKDFGLLVLRSSNIQNGMLAFDDCVFVDCKIDDSKYVQPRDILICVRNGSSALIGKSCVIDKPYNATFGAFMSVLRGDKTGYIAQIFASGIVQSQIRNRSSATINQITKRDFEEIIIPIPIDEAEQRAIAKALSDVDAYIVKLEKLIAKRRHIKQGTMQELLTAKRRLPGFSGEWLNKTLGDVGTITGSGVDKKINTNEEPVTLLNYLDVYRYAYIKQRMLHQNVTAKREKLLQCNVLKGDVFFTPTSETADDIARTAVSVEDMSGVAYSYHVVRLRPYENYNGEFIKYACDTAEVGKQTARLADGSGTRYVISLPNFREHITIRVPPTKNEQTAIAEILSDMDAEIDALTAKLNKARHIKQGMMQELLTGKIRLVGQGTSTKTAKAK